MPLTLRLSKQTELTHRELDDNFEYLEGLALGATGSTDYISDIELTSGSLVVTGTGGAFSGSIDLSGINTDTRDYVSNVTFANGTLSFTGAGSAFASTVDISGVNTDTRDYVSNVTFDGGTLTFTGAGSAFASTVDISGVNTDTRDYISSISFADNTLSFTGEGAAATTTVDLGSLAGGGTDLTAFSVVLGTASGGGSLSYSSSNGQFTFAPADLSSVSGGSTSPGGSDGQVQFNNTGSFGGDSGLTYNRTADTLTITSTNSNPSLKFSTAFPPVAPVPGFVFAELQAHSHTYSKEIGSVQFQLDATSNPSGYSSGNIPSKFVIQTTPDGSGTPTTKLEVRDDGKLHLNKYGVGTFTGIAAKWLAVDTSGNVIEEDAPSSGGASTEPSMNAIVNSFDDVVYDVDSNSTEVIIGDSTPVGYSTIDEINGKTILIDQSNTNNGTLRFGFASWTERTSIDGRTAKQDFKCEGFNIGQDDFNVGVYLPEGTWDIYQIGHQAGGGDRVSEYQTNVIIGAGGSPRYFTKAMIEGSKFNVYYNYFHKKVVVWCSAWTGTGGATGEVAFSAADPNIQT